MSRMPPSLSGLLCAKAAVADIASMVATMAVVVFFKNPSHLTRRIDCDVDIFGSIMPHGILSGKRMSKCLKMRFPPSGNRMGGVKRIHHRSTRKIDRSTFVQMIVQPLHLTEQKRKAATQNHLLSFINLR